MATWEDHCEAAALMLSRVSKLSVDRQVMGSSSPKHTMGHLVEYIVVGR